MCRDATLLIYMSDGQRRAAPEVFDFFGYIDDVHLDYMGIMSADNPDDTATQNLLEALASTANKMFVAHDIFETEAFLTVEGSKAHCKFAEFGEFGIRLVDFEPSEDAIADGEVEASYEGIVVQNEEFDITPAAPVSLTVPRLVHKLCVAEQYIIDPLYTQIAKRYAILPIEHTESLGIILPSDIN